MKTFVLVAALLAAWSVQPGWAAGKPHSSCTAPSALEAEQAIRYVTDVMVASSACRNTIYAEFALRNRLAIIAYQKAMIARMHGAPAFDRWNTALANIVAQRQAMVPITQFCQQSEPLLKQASALDTKGFRAYAAQAAVAQSASTGCGK